MNTLPMPGALASADGGRDSSDTAAHHSFDAEKAPMGEQVVEAPTQAELPQSQRKKSSSGGEPCLSSSAYSTVRTEHESLR